jgi:hypothetical protein
MKTVKAIEFAHEMFLVPAGLSERELVTFLGTLAVLQRVHSEFSSDYDRHFSYVVDSATIKTINRVVYDTQEEAKAARDEYNAAVDKKRQEALA